MAKPVQAREGREPYWRQVVVRWERSGMGVPALYRKEGVNQATSNRWRWELKRCDQTKSAFLAVRVIPDKPALPTGGKRSSWPIEGASASELASLPAPWCSCLCCTNVEVKTYYCTIGLDTVRIRRL